MSQSSVDPVFELECHVGAGNWLVINWMPIAINVIDSNDHFHISKS